jgi:predicted Zn-dependent peptidase
MRVKTHCQFSIILSEFYTYTLPNGIRCILKRVKSAVAHCALTVNTGSRDELSGEHGMAHLVEHTLFKGTKRRKAHHINCRLENLGGELNAFTTKEETVIHTTTLRSDYSKAVELIADIVFHSVFPEREIEKEKQVIFDEINLYKDTPGDRIYDEFEDMIFAGSPLGHNILGSRQSLSKLRSSNIKQFMERTYNTDSMVFSLIGNVSEKAFTEAMLRYFGDIPASRRTFARECPAVLPPFEKSIGRSTHQVHCMIGRQAYSLNDSRRLPLLLLINTLGGPSANSLLNVLLRERNALSYTVEAAYTPFSDTGLATIYFSSEKDKSERCVELIHSLLSDLKNGCISPRRLSIAKKQFIAQFSIMTENNEGYMLGAAKSYLVFDTIDTLTAVNEKINGITRDDVSAVAGEIFSDMSMLTYR